MSPVLLMCIYVCVCPCILDLGVLPQRMSELDGTIKIPVLCLITKLYCYCLMVIKRFLECPGKWQIGSIGLVLEKYLSKVLLPRPPYTLHSSVWYLVL